MDGPGVGSCIGISSSSILVKLSTEIGKTGEVSFLFFFCHFNFDNRWFLCYNFLSPAICKKSKEALFKTMFDHVKCGKHLCLQKTLSLFKFFMKH